MNRTQIAECVSQEREAPLRANRRVTWLLFLSAWLLCVGILPGPVGAVSDTYNRWVAARWMWSGGMAVFAATEGTFTDNHALRMPPGLPGRNGVLHSWYGAGQSLLLVPADMISAGLLRFTRFHDSDNMRFQVVCYLLFPMLNAATVVIAFGLLRTLQFTVPQAVSGSLGLLLFSTFLWHSQNNQENNLQLLLTLAALTAALRWRKEGGDWRLLLCAVLVGFNLLIRVTTIADVLAVSVFILIISPGWDTLKRLIYYFGPTVATYLALDRAYHWWRFGALWGTYMGMLGDAQKVLNPSLSQAFPFDASFWTGFLGPLISPGKSVFLYDPLLFVTVIGSVVMWRKLRREVKAYIVAMLTLFVVTSAIYAKYYNWGGEAGWGDRFVTTGVHGATLLAFPLISTLSGRFLKIFLSMIAASALVIQISSLIFPSWVEFMQNGRREQRTELLPGCAPTAEYFIVGERVGNVAHWISGTESGSMTCDGQPLGRPPVTLIPLLPLTTLPLLSRIAIRGVWCLMFGLSVWCMALAMRRARHSASATGWTLSRA